MDLVDRLEALDEAPATPRYGGRLARHRKLVLIFAYLSDSRVWVIKNPHVPG